MIRRAALLAVALVLPGCMGGSDDEPVARYLVFTKAIDQPQQAVWIGDVSGNKMRRLTRGVYGLVSPDGRRIAVWRRGSGILTVDPGGGDERFVAHGRPAAWLPDSRHLLASQGEALVNVDVDRGTVAVIERRKSVTWSISPDGKSIAYDIYRDPPGPSECWFDIYTTRVNGDSKRRLTRDGRSSNPVWGDDWIAFAYRPPGTGCFAPRVWKMRPDGSQKQPIMTQLPRRFSSSGYYGVRPFSWVRDRPLLLATVPTEWGNELALVNSRNGSTRKPDLDPRPRYTSPMYADHASREGQHVVGAACGAEWPSTIQIFSVTDGRAKDVYRGMASWPDWNR
ncbi:MAG TPA: hypothetical protein VFM83_06790 [Gaiellaceae bacterium]|nr:hypothetical protein [Gaiellaceae bacterium]